ncbi:MAG TPA: DUF4340 domain-containing protein, partial [Bryobacteraceae bacterium]|nr:DUF4340 domain-containing protein [Bryobacteraceae bacterium]
GLLIAVVVLAVLAGGVWWSQRVKSAEADKPSPTAAPKLITMSEADAQRVEIGKRDAETTVLEKQNGKWRITAPVALAADDDTATSVVSGMTGLNWDQLVEEKPADLGQFGLDKPAVRVTLAGKGSAAKTLLIGDETPTAGSFYAKLDGDPRVFTISSYTKGNLDKTARDLRDKRLLTFSDEKLSRVELTAKGQTIELGKNAQNEWQIVRPTLLRADGNAVDELVRKLREAKMDTSVSADDEKKAPGAFASGSRVATVRVTDASGTQQLEMRKKGDAHYARSSVVEGVFKIASDVATALDKGLEDIRNKKVFDFGFADPNRVEVRYADKAFTFEKSGDAWKSDGKTMDSTTVQVLIDKLRDLAATKFPAGGFGTAVMDIVVSSNAGKRVEKVGLARLGTNYVARRENEPALYEVTAASVGEIQKAAADVKPAQPSTAGQKK